MVVQGLNSKNVVEEFKRIVKAWPKKLITVSIDLLFSFTQKNSDTMRFGTKMLRDKQQSKGLKRKPKPMINRPSKKVKLEDVKMEIETIAVKEET